MTDAPSPVTVEGKPFTETGKTHLSTPSGHEFRPHGEGLPVITEYGVRVTAEQAENILEQSDASGGRVFITTETEA